MLVKPVSEEAAESNLLVTTVNGAHLSFLLRSEGPSARSPVDLVMSYRPAGSFLVEESAVSTGEIAGTSELAPIRPIAAVNPPRSAALRPARVLPELAVEPSEHDGLATLLERQQRAKLPPLYGMRTATPEGKGDLVKVGISEVIDQGGEVVVLFSVVNPQAHSVGDPAATDSVGGKVEEGVSGQAEPLGHEPTVSSKRFPAGTTPYRPG